MAWTFHSFDFLLKTQRHCNNDWSNINNKNWISGGVVTAVVVVFIDNVNNSTQKLCVLVVVSTKQWLPLISSCPIYTIKYKFCFFIAFTIDCVCIWIKNICWSLLALISNMLRRCAMISFFIIKSNKPMHSIYSAIAQVFWKFISKC